MNEIIDFVLRHEGGYSNDPHDPGGETTLAFPGGPIRIWTSRASLGRPPPKSIAETTGNGHRLIIFPRIWPSGSAIPR